MRVRIVFLLLAMGVSSGAACSLNPQPLPPFTGDAGGPIPDARGGGIDAAEDVGVLPFPPEAGPELDGASDVGTATDATNGLEDAASDAADDTARE